MDRSVEGNDNKIEEWAKEQDQKDQDELKAYQEANQAAKQLEEEKKMEEVMQRLQEEEKQVDTVPLQVD